jgi:hypothetical protein
MIFQGINHVIGTCILEGVAEYSFVRGGVNLLGLGVIDASEVTQTRIIRAQFKSVSAALVVVANLQTAPIAGIGLAIDRHFLADGGVATRAIVHETDANHIIAVASELVAEVVFVV